MPHWQAPADVHVLAPMPQSMHVAPAAPHVDAERVSHFAFKLGGAVQVAQRQLAFLALLNSIQLVRALLNRESAAAVVPARQLRLPAF